MKKIFCLVLALTLALCGFAAAEEEDYQNPTMNVIGSYADETSGRAYMDITAGEGNSAFVTINWSDSAFAEVIWEFEGEFNTEDNTIVYENCIKTYFNYDGEDASAEILYEDGTGKLIIHEDWSITWQDDKEDAGADCLFTYYDIPLDFEDADGQNPVMNIIGIYDDAVSERASMDIEAFGADGASVEIVWPSSADEWTVWNFTGTYDAGENAVIYTDCVKTDWTSDENGIAAAVLGYENGAGKLVIGEDGSITWQDDTENAGADCLFVFSDIQ